MRVCLSRLHTPTKALQCGCLLGFTGQQHRELGDDIKGLGDNLDILQKILDRAQLRQEVSFSESRLPTFEHLDQVIKGSRTVLRECDRFLSGHAVYRRRDGPISNLIWSLEADEEAKGLRERIAFLNIKVIDLRQARRPLWSFKGS